MRSSSAGTTRLRARCRRARRFSHCRTPTPDIGDLDALILSPGIPHLLPVPHRIAAAARLAGRKADPDGRRIALSGGARRRQPRPIRQALPARTANPPRPPCWPISLTEAGVPQRRRRQSRAGRAEPESCLPDNGVYVLEMSSYMLERLATLTRFDAAVHAQSQPRSSGSPW